MKASASKAALLMKCQYSFRDDVESPKEKPSPQAARGTLVHKLIADFVNFRHYPSFDHPEWILRRAIQGIDAAKVQPTPQAEVTYAIGQDDAKVIGSNVARDTYPPDMFCGTADLIWEDDAGIHIRDWKTGSPGDSEEWQLRALAAMAHAATGKPVASGKAVYLTDVAPRFGDDVLKGTDPKEDLVTLRRHLAIVPKSAPVPGYHCAAMWCTLRKVCPAVAS